MTEPAFPRWLPRALALAPLFYSEFLMGQWALGRPLTATVQSFRVGVCDAIRRG